MFELHAFEQIVARVFGLACLKLGPALMGRLVEREK